MIALLLTLTLANVVLVLMARVVYRDAVRERQKAARRLLTEEAARKRF